jgi:integrase
LTGSLPARDIYRVAHFLSGYCAQWITWESVLGNLLEVLKAWKQTTQFSAPEDWIFASPAQLGRLPWSYPHILKLLVKTALDGGIAHVSTHTMRHTHRSWLDAVGTPIAVQQRLMRYASITTTMDHYGDVVTDEMTMASSKVAGLALNGSQTDPRAS